MSITLKAQIEQALSKVTISDYLSSKGFEPEVYSSGKAKYLCPFPDHCETKPSFVVYKDKEIETFYCFGCSRGYNVVHLISKLEKISFKSALEKIIPEFNASCLDESDYVLEQVLNEFTKNHEEDLSETLLSISAQCLAFLNKTSYDSQETELVDKLYKEIDNRMIFLDFDELCEDLKKCDKKLKDIFECRIDKLHEKKEKEMEQLYAI